VPIVLKSRSLNLLEPSGPVQACNGIALPLPLPLTIFLCRIPPGRWSKETETCRRFTSYIIVSKYCIIVVLQGVIFYLTDRRRPDALVFLKIIIITIVA